MSNPCRLDDTTQNKITYAIWYENGRTEAIDEIISYLNDCRLIEGNKGCYECLSELMEKIEQLKEQKND